MNTRLLIAILLVISITACKSTDSAKSSKTQLSYKGEKLDEFPKAVCKQKNLVELDMSPLTVGVSGNLDYLLERPNKLKQLPDCIGNLKNLKKLNLQGTSLKSLPSSFGNLSSLEELDISFNPDLDFTKETTKLKKLSSLKWLNVTGSGIKSPQMKEIKNAIPGVEVVINKYKYE